MVMKHCNIDAVLQIVRPDEAGQDGDGIKFCAKAENENVRKACDGKCPCKPKGYRTPWKPVAAFAHWNMIQYVVKTAKPIPTVAPWDAQWEFHVHNE
uniref:Uncharacterized protein n=1 Tax=Magallana gigas TaxID=29159 RepID=K1R334_MAGGI